MQQPLKIISNYEKQKFEEEHQNYPCKFAYALLKDDSVEVLHTPVLCRDFLNDTLLWKSGSVPIPKKAKYCALKKDWVDDGIGAIYGYNFTGPIDEENTTFFVSNLSRADLSRAEKNFEIFERFVKESGMKPSTLLKTNRQRSYVIVGDKEWMKTTALLSMYTWAIRNLLYPKKPNECVQGVYGDSETIWSAVEKIKNLPRKQVYLLKDIKSSKPYNYHALNGFMTYLFQRSLTIHA